MPKRSLHHHFSGSIMPNRLEDAIAEDFYHPSWKYQGNLPLETGRILCTQTEVNCAYKQRIMENGQSKT
jgi:hypothetical protein